jgi:hypothetical protein
LDGCNDAGEEIFSGVYHTLQVGEVIPRIGAGEFQATRKIALVK